MHEMSLCEGVLHIIEREAQTQGFGRVKTVWLEIGALAGVEPEAMRFCFDAVMRGSLADGAGLEIIAAPGVAWCLPCGKNVAVSQLYDVCPNCSGHQLQIVGGDQMRIKELEVE